VSKAGPVKADPTIAADNRWATAPERGVAAAATAAVGGAGYTAAAAAASSSSSSSGAAAGHTAAAAAAQYAAAQQQQQQQQHAAAMQGYGSGATVVAGPSSSGSAVNTARHWGSRPTSAARSRSAAPGTSTAKVGEVESAISAQMVGEESDGDDAGGTHAGVSKPGHGTVHPSASSVTASVGSNTPGHGADAAAQPTSEEALKQALREREQQLRLKLKAFVSSPEFGGRSTTDFYGFGKVLGQGSFGKVRLAWHRLAGAKVAIKSYEKEKLKEPNHWRRVQQEIRCAAVALLLPLPVVAVVVLPAIVAVLPAVVVPPPTVVVLPRVVLLTATRARACP
jgi:hypothetical protein